MIIRVMPNKIPKIWDTIKFAIKQVSNIQDNIVQGVINNKILHSLLSSKSQCFLFVNDFDKIQVIAVTKMMVNDGDKYKTLHIQGFFGYEKSTFENLYSLLDFIKQFAKKEECIGIAFSTSNPKIIKLAQPFNAKEVSRNYKIEIRG